MSYKTNIYLKKGWNLVSFYLDKISFETIIENDNIVEIKSINRSFNRKIPINLNTLKKISQGDGYWIKSKEETIVEFSGDVNNIDFTYDLKKGWNLIGYPFNLPFNLSNIDKNIIEIKNLVKSYNKILPKSLNTLKELNFNEGYWVKSETDFKLKLSYPFDYLKKDVNNQVLGLIYHDEIDIKTLENSYEKDTYCLSDNLDSDIEIPWSNKKINYYDVKKIKDSIKELKFTIYYGDWNGKQKTIGIEFHNKLNVFDYFEGNIKINLNEYNEENKIVEIYFGNNKKNKILFNILRKIIVIGYKEELCFINNIDYKAIDDIKIKKINPKTDSVFLTDYNLKNIQINDLVLIKNSDIINYNYFNTSYNFTTNQLMINIKSDDDSYIMYFDSLDNPHKTISFNFFIESGENHKEEVLLIFNKSFNFVINDDIYQISFKWDGSLKNDISYVLSKFTESSNYLYWFDFREIVFNEINLNNNLINRFEILESKKDYIILESEIVNKNYKIIIIKDAIYKGCINLTYKIKNSNDIEYNDSNTYSVSWAIFNDISFLIDGKFMKLKWSGKRDELGYSIESESTKQRLFGLNLNSYRIYDFGNIKIKVHYSIGNSEDSINLNFWNSYDSFLNILEKLLEYMLEFINDYGLKLPGDDSFLKRNGGDASYDVYVLKIDNKNIKGYTAGEAYNPFTKNTLDISTYLVISNDLDYDWLKTVLFHEFFHSLQSGYDWFESEWISEGLAVAFESIISTNNISSKYFIPHFFEKRNLAISYSGNMSFDYQNLLTTSPLSLFNGEKGDIVLHISDLASYNNNISIYSMKLDKLQIKSFSTSNLKLVKSSKYVYRGRTILFLKLSSDKSTKDLKFQIYYDNKLINRVVPAFLTRHYGSFTFFEYLAEKYDEKIIFKNIMEQSIPYNQIDILEKVITDINPQSDFMRELINFWVAVELMTSSNRVAQKYRILKSEMWQLCYFKNFYDILQITDETKNILIDNLEPTGCINLSILFGNKSSTYFNISKNININHLHFRAIIEYQSGDFSIIEIKPEYSFKLTFNKSVFKICLLIIADKIFPSNKDILLEYSSDEPKIKKLTHVEVDSLKFVIDVSKK